MAPHCACVARHDPPLVAVTGGPGAGKTAVLELVRRHFCHHVVVLPEAASIVYGGGFPRHAGDACRRAAQRAIFHVQRALESMAVDEGEAAIVLCDRGTIDGLAYWPGDPAEYWAGIGSTHAAELARYAAVVHLRTPSSSSGYDQRNVLRIETSDEAHAIDERIGAVWAAHPRRFEIASDPDFYRKAGHAIAVVSQLLPACCRQTGHGAC